MPMELINIIPASDLAKLKRLAGDISAAEAPELGVLDEIASLAAEIATRCREGMRQQLLEEVITAAQAIFPTAGQDLRLRLAQTSFDELANLAAPLDETAAAQTALTEADVGLMAARDRGDY